MSLLVLATQSSRKEIKEQISEWISLKVGETEFRITAYSDGNKTKVCFEADQSVEISREERTVCK